MGISLFTSFSISYNSSEDSNIGKMLSANCRWTNYSALISTAIPSSSFWWKILSSHIADSGWEIVLHCLIIFQRLIWSFALSNRNIALVIAYVRKGFYNHFLLLSCSHNELKSAECPTTEIDCRKFWDQSTFNAYYS